MREAIARLVWIGAGGNDSAWDEVKARDRSGPNRPNYVDEKADEAWATADLILEHLSGTSSTMPLPLAGCTNDLLGAGR